MKINLISDLDRDIKNWQESVISKSYGIDWASYLPSDIKLSAVKNTNKLREYLQEKYYGNGKIDEFIEFIKNSIKDIDIEGEQNQIFGTNINLGEIKIYVTTFHRAPYDTEDNSFFIIYRDHGCLDTVTGIYHEINHLYFHRLFDEFFNTTKVSDEQAQDIKESFTVLLNPYLDKHGFPLDDGYDIHKKLRAYIQTDYQEKRSVEAVVKDIVKDPSRFL